MHNHHTKQPREETGLKGMYNAWLPGPPRTGGFPVIPETREEEDEDEAEEQQEEETAMAGPAGGGLGLKVVEQKEKEETVMAGPAGGSLGLKVAMVDSSWMSSPVAQISYYGGHWTGDRRGRLGMCQSVCLSVYMSVYMFILLFCNCVHSQTTQSRVNRWPDRRHHRPHTLHR